MRDCGCGEVCVGIWACARFGLLPANNRARVANRNKGRVVTKFNSSSIFIDRCLSFYEHLFVPTSTWPTISFAKQKSVHALPHAVTRWHSPNRLLALPANTRVHAAGQGVRTGVSFCFGSMLRNVYRGKS